jgi:triacylglycerol lipase
MLSRWLRRCLILELALLLTAVVILVRTQVASPIAAIALGIACFLALNASPFLIALAYSRATPTKSHLEVPRLLAWRRALGECLAGLVLFIVVQPFERWWMGRDAVGRQAPSAPPVLLVHGYLCNRACWWWLRRKLKAQHLVVATLNLEPLFGDIDDFAEQLHRRIEVLTAETGGNRVVLIAHSMGGLAARSYLKRHGGSRVAQLITLASPHHGTRVARVAVGLDGRQMEPTSQWLAQLAAGESMTVPTVSLWTASDELVVPQDSCCLPGARNVVVSAVGHVGILFSPAVLKHLQAELIPPDL